MKRIDLTGQAFHRWTVLEFVGTTKQRASIWLCQCECGKQKIVVGQTLLRNCSKSCGCLQKEIAASNSTKHGKAHTPEYKIWTNIKTRCYNNNRNDYRNYGGRGIKVCDRWLNSFESFLEDMGQKPTGHEIDRIDNDGNYCPENCRWVIPIMNSRNRRKTIKLTYHGETLSLVEWAERLGKSYSCLQSRYYRDWPIHKILSA